jgi:hypothetical protein
LTSALEDLLGRVKALPPDKKAALQKDAMLATAGRLWVPNVGPQSGAHFSLADETFYGGQAGGGKTDLAIGLSITEHRRSLILRRINKDAVKLVERLAEIVGHRNGYNGQLQRWKLGNRLVEFGGCEQEDDKQRYKGDPHDLIVFDEGSDFLESQFRFIIGWNRSAIAGQRCRVLVTSNPPTTAAGLWVIKYWGAWLDPLHPNPALPGELRWYTTINGVDTEVDGPGPHVIEGEREPIMARSRTYIPAALSDNPDLARTNYGSVLASLPDELRRAYRDGDFSVGQKDDDWQVIPTGWIEAAQQRWNPTPPRGYQMTAMAVDVAPGGGDQRVIAFRYGGWFAPLEAERVVDKTGRLTAASVVKHRRDRCPVIVDLGGGWGGDALIALKDNGIPVVAFNGVVDSTAKTRDGKLGFRNKRAEATWRLREALDPEQEGGSVIALPPDAELKADLASYKWINTTGGILLEDKEKTKKKLGRSPDKGDAVVMCVSEGDIAVAREARRNAHAGGIKANLGYAKQKSGRLR